VSAEDQIRAARRHVVYEDCSDVARSHQRGKKLGRTRFAKQVGAGSFSRADARIRTADPFITSEVLYQLSYVGERLE
jgi:hypothetical protein